MNLLAKNRRLNNVKHCNKYFLLHLMVAPQLSSGWRHNYSTKTRPAGHAKEQPMHSLMSMVIGKEKPVF
jgi:hypothetical protein